MDPAPAAKIQNVTPIVGDWYAPQHVHDQSWAPNIIQRDDEDGPEYASVKEPPPINQLTRLNSMFVVPSQWRPAITEDSDLSLWRPVTEWENPIWGWVVINFANNGVQFFLPNGRFYREIRLRSSEGSLTTPEWLPFPRPDDAGQDPADPTKPTDPGLLQLKLIVDKLSNDIYLTELVQMINNFTSSVEPATDSHAEFTNALVGRPLALVNVGWSLDLASEPFQSQVDETEKPPISLTKNKESLENYDLQLKLGDKQGGFDGLVAYFKTKKDNFTPGDFLNLTNFYTEFDKPIPPEDPFQVPTFKYLQPPEYQKVYAFWIDPKNKSADGYDNARNKELEVVGVLMDPFSPVHISSDIVQVKELSLPPWTWQDAISSMKAFLHAGPLLVVNDVPGFTKQNELQPDSSVDLPKKEKDDDTAIEVPALSGAQWAWLQPYTQKDPEQDPEQQSENILGDDAPIVLKPPEQYMALPVGVEDNRAKFMKQPYTAIEGFLQMAAPLTKKT